MLLRHWDWLAGQPEGASAALRKLAEEARRQNSEKDRVRDKQKSACRFMTVMGGNLPGYEESIRALFAGNQLQFNAMVASWPVDVRNHAREIDGGIVPQHRSLTFDQKSLPQTRPAKAEGENALSQTNLPPPGSRANARSSVPARFNLLLADYGKHSIFTAKHP